MHRCFATKPFYIKSHQQRPDGSTSIAAKMNCGIFLVFVALAAAVPLGSNDVRIDDEGTIIVSTDHGRVLFSNGHDDEHHMVIVVKIIDRPTRTIEISHDNRVVKNVTHSQDNNAHHGRDKRAVHSETVHPQLIVLKNIFKEHQGVIDDATFDQVLSQVKKAVELGQVHVAVYDALNELVSHHHHHHQVGSQSWEKQSQKRSSEGLPYQHHYYPQNDHSYPFNYQHHEQSYPYTYGQHHYDESQAYGQFYPFTYSKHHDDSQTYGQSYPFTHGSYHDSPQYHHHQHDLEVAISQCPSLKAWLSGVAGHGFHEEPVGESTAQVAVWFLNQIGYHKQHHHQQNEHAHEQIHELVSQLRHEQHEAEHLIRRQHHINQQLQYLQAVQASSHYHAMGHGQQQGIQQEQQALIREQQAVVQQHSEHQQKVQQLHEELEKQLDHLRYGQETGDVDDGHHE